ncbi:MAG: ABC transporter substrate-binding protein, partial [Clostridia bacterium]|nr:ABC transporter substrate-binding protein [Clostridia bacterium]
MKRTIIALLMALVMLVSITACSAPAETPAEPSAPTESEAPADTAAPEEPAAEVYNIGICQLMPHAALDAATQGFMDALEEALPNQVNFDHQDAAGDVPT